jgi:NADPH:quinone reductase-like Zn-dependent oxidoreductase
MKINAVVAPTYGGPDVVTLIETELAAPATGQVLVEVRAAATNPIDYKLFSGHYGDDPSKLPMRLGLEVSGVVLATEGEVTGPSAPIHVGDEVIVYPAPGGYATAVVADAELVVAKPQNMSFEEASGLMLCGTTAVHALRAASVGAGNTVLINGASGGVGLLAVQIAVDDGARVIATASATQHEMLRDLGAEPVLYGEGLLERVRELAPEGVDAAIDLIGTDEAADVSMALVADPSRLATIVGSSKGARLGMKALGMGPNADPGVAIRSAARLDLVRRVEEGSLKVFLDATFALADAADALRDLAQGHSHGKIVLIP